MNGIDMESCMYNDTGPITILPNKTIGELYFRDTIEIQFDVELSTTPCLELDWCLIFSIGAWHRLPFIYIRYGWDVNLQIHRYALIYEMISSSYNLLEYYIYPKDAENNIVIDGRVHNLYSKFTLTSTLIILDHNIIIANKTLPDISIRDNWYFGTDLPIMAAWHNPPYPEWDNNGTGVWNGTITNLCINTYNYTAPSTESQTRTRSPSLSPLPHNCYSQGPCNPGYVDQTKGNYNNWGCAYHCDGGFYTDNNCQCACIPDINGDGCFYSTAIPDENPQSQEININDNDLDIEIVIITILCAVILILTAVAIIMCLIHRIKNKLKMDENERIDHENINLKNDGIEKWLTNKCDLPQYLDNFMENGYDSMDRIALINQVDELEEIGIKLKGHQKTILSEISKLPKSNAIEPNEGETQTLNSSPIYLNSLAKSNKNTSKKYQFNVINQVYIDHIQL